MEISGEVLGAIMFLCIALVLALLVWFRYRGKEDTQVTIRMAIDKGQELSPELIENLVNPRVSPVRDLRRGVISVLLAVGIALFGVILGEQDAVRPLLGIAMFPLSIGAGFLLMHRFGRSS